MNQFSLFNVLNVVLLMILNYSIRVRIKIRQTLVYFALMKHVYRLSISTLLIAFFSVTVKAQTNVQDSLALVDIYNSTNGASWTIKNNWLSKQPVSKWYGITISANKVIGIALINNNLTGTLPSSMGNITYLNTIHLEQNFLTGSIPQTIGNLYFLQLFSISGNKFTGRIPQTLGNLSLLSYVDLSFNNFSDTIPSELGSLSNLGNLFLFSNNLTGHIPTSFGNLTSLQYLSLDYNHLSDTIPNSLGNLYKLKTLTLSNNALTGAIPSSIGNLSSLLKLDLNSNQLTGSIPSSIGNLININTISLQYNRLSGALPISINNLSALTTLNLNNNHLSGELPLGLINISGLTNFPIYNNHFTFAGMEAIANDALYSPQGNISIIQKGTTLCVSVGGTPANNTFQWYKNSKLVATIISDSTYTVTSTGSYWVVVKNSVATQLTLYSDTAIVSTLPINNISLKALAASGQNLLSWQTVNEVNNKSFVVERSLNGIGYTKIATINAIGIGNNNYSFSDNNLIGIENSVFYYRIQSIDKEGNVDCSNVVLVDVPLVNNIISIYPNPLRGIEMLTINANHICEIRVSDINGKVINIASYYDATKPQLTLNSLIPGIYFVKLKQVDGGLKTIKLIKE